MKKHLIQFLMVCSLFICSTAAWAQTTVKGVVVDAENNEPLLGAAVMESGTTNGTATDMDGAFELKVAKNATLIIKYVGFKDLALKVSQKGNITDLGVIKLESDAVMLKDVVITSSVAVARKTPVAMSSVPTLYIEEKLGTQEFPEILKSTPGVHANKQGGGYGDSEIYMRGFDNTNVATMINGVPMNDMENGTVYWSNWSGLSDVTRSMQTQRGLGASKVSAPSVGGTINIITKGLESKRGGNVSYAMGSNNMSKILFTVSTGMSESGWALTLLGAKQEGDGTAQGLDFVGYNYFANIAKKLNDNHQLSLTAFGAPQEHYQRGNNSALTIENWKMVEQKYGVTNYRYNATYGFDQNGQRKTSDYNVYHKPQISLNHQWAINDKSSLSTSVYMSIGRGYGYSGQANGANSSYTDIDGKSYTYQSWYGGRYGQLYDTFRKSDGTFDYGAINQINSTSEYGSLMVMTKSKNYHNWYGLLSTFTTQIGKNIDFYGGVDFRYYKGTHTNEIIDLYGGDYYMDDYRATVNVSQNKKAADQSWVTQKLGVGDVVYRDYDSHVVQEGGFFQAEYNKDKLSAFVSGSLSNTTYWRYGRFYYDEAHAKSKTVSYIGFTAKGGANYNLNDNHNVFVNVGYISRAPKFAYGAFMTSTTSNVINPNAKNEKIFSVEAGYGYRNDWMTANLNVYYTNWLDKTMTKTGTLDNQETYYMNMTGVNALHKGVELEAKIKATPWLDINAMFSLGDWTWNSNATGYAYNDQGLPLTSKGEIASAVLAPDHAWATINLKGVRVGGSAQTTAALGFDAKLDKHLSFSVDGNYIGRNYSYYSFSGNNLSIGKELSVAEPWKVPAAVTFDLSGRYKFKMAGLDATFSGNVNNLLNYQYILKAWNPSSLTTAADETNIYCFFNTGRTYTLRLKVAF